MDYTTYDKILSRYAIGIALICAMLFVIAILMFIYAIRHSDRTVGIIGGILSLLVIISSVVLAYVTITKAICDITNKAYITYEGDFTIESGGRSSIWIYINDGSVKLDSNKGLDSGEYNGKVIYSKYSKFVFDVQGIMTK